MRDKILCLQSAQAARYCGCTMRAISKSSFIMRVTLNPVSRKRLVDPNDECT